MAQRSYKTDESFLEKLAIGAIGTQKVIEDLRTQGHIPIELERGSTGYKIWKTIKIKRVRVPDILCVNSGIRIESRAKTKLVISMSHSSADETRGWDFGLKDEDFVALVVCQKTGEEPIDWIAEELIQYIKVSDLRQAFEADKVIQEKPKGAEEGFEARLTWPSSVANSDGQIIEIASRIKYKRNIDNRSISLALSKRGIPLIPCIHSGDKVRRNQILASVAPVFKSVPMGSINPQVYYQELLSSTAISDRYGAAKACSYLGDHFSKELLNERVKDKAEHIYVKLEAAAALARMKDHNGYSFIESALASDYLEHRLEAVIILGEISTERSAQLLTQVLMDNTQHEEIRGGAAWALGELNLQSTIKYLIATFKEIHLPIRIEAARALKKMCDQHMNTVLDYFKTANEEERPGVSWALGLHGGWEFDELIDRIDFNDFDMRQWAAFIIGNTDSHRIIKGIEALKEKDPQLYFAVTVLWKITSSWVYNLKEY